MPALPAGPPVDCQLSPFLATAIGLSLAVVAFPTLVPEGSGWAWGAPLTELRWYLTGLTSPATLLQLVGKPAAARGPRGVGRATVAPTGPARPVATAHAAGGTVEWLQSLLPLGRVVSPVDALVDTTAAVLTGFLVSAADRRLLTGRAGTA